MKAYYLCSMVGDGSRFNQFRPALHDLVSQLGAGYAVCYEDSDTDKSTVVLAISDTLSNGTIAAGLHDECTRQAILLGENFQKAKRFLGQINQGAASKLVDNGAGLP